MMLSPQAKHTPSQAPERHSASWPQASPTALAKQAPTPSQARVPTHSLSGSVSAITGPQRPSVMPDLRNVQASQAPLHAALQLMKSLQNPLSHSWPAKHGAPRSKV